MGRYELLHDGMLGVVGVLILVNQHKLKLALIDLEHLGVVAEEEVGVVKQVIEIHGVALFATGHVALVDVAHQGDVLLLVGQDGFAAGGIGLGRHQAVFGGRDAPLHHPRLIDLLVEAQVLEDGAHQAFAVGGVIDGEVGGEPQVGRLGVQDAEEDAVKGAHPEARGHLLPHPAGHALLHLAGGLVGKGQRQDVPRLHALIQQVSHLVGQHTRLSRARPGYHQRGAVQILHRPPLALIQIVQIVLHTL